MSIRIPCKGILWSHLGWADRAIHRWDSDPSSYVQGEPLDDWIVLLPGTSDVVSQHAITTLDTTFVTVSYRCEHTRATSLTYSAHWIPFRRSVMFISVLTQGNQQKWVASTYWAAHAIVFEVLFHVQVDDAFPLGNRDSSACSICVALSRSKVNVNA